MLIRILINLQEAGGPSTYLTLATQLATGFRNRLQSFTGSSLIWDLGHGTEPGHSLDTAHANRVPYMVVDFVRAQVVLTAAQRTGIANLLGAVIWDQSLSSPRFTNYIDGNNDPFLSRPAWNNGLIYIGWVELGSFDRRVQSIGEATLNAIR